MAAGRHIASRACAAFAAFAIFAALGTDTAPAAFPGKPGPIVYRKTFTREADNSRNSRTTGGLFVHGLHLGEAPRQLTSDPSDQEPSFSADGRKIVFENPIEGFSPDLFVMRSDGSGRRLVTEDGMQPAFFPDSRRIVFKRDSWIFSIRIDGAGLRPITSSPFVDHEPVVSPDGESIAFVRTRRGNEAIYVVDSGGGKPRRAIDLPSDDDDPEWSPDGRRIVFTGNRHGCGAGIYVARVDGSRIRRLTPCERSGRRIYNHPAFSPDGRHVVALRHGRGAHSIVLIRADGGGVVGAVDSGHPEEEGLGIYVGVPGWGPLPR